MKARERKEKCKSRKGKGRKKNRVGKAREGEPWLSPVCCKASIGIYTYN